MTCGRSYEVSVGVFRNRSRIGSMGAFGVGGGSLLGDRAVPGRGAETSLPKNAEPRRHDEIQGVV